MNSKKKICKRCEKEVYIFARGLCKSCDMVVNSKKYMIDRTAKPKKESKEKAKSVTQLKAQLDKVFSLYIRQKYADDAGNVECYTCGVVKPIKNMQNAHFWSRKYLSVRWEEKNCRVCCAGCNVFLHGNYIEYTRRLLKEIGQDKFDKLELQKNSTLKADKAYLIEKIEYYNKLVK